MALNVKPLGGRILLEAAEEKENKGKKGGIIIPDTAKEKPMESVVVALGTGKTDDQGKKAFHVASSLTWFGSCHGIARMRMRRNST